MSGHSVVQRIKELVAPIIESQNLELVEVEFKHEGQVQYLRIFIDTPDGVTIDDCQKISRECEAILDIESIIQTQYVLEVSSPGLNRPLKTQRDYERFQGRLVKLKTFRPVHGQRKFLGRLQGLRKEAGEPSSETVILLKDDEEIHIPFELIASARLEIEI